ncbi:hypothetical protein V8E51_015241 [Hyaloscypha variabilis]
MSCEDGNLKLSTFNSRTNLPPAMKHSVKSGDAVFAIAKRYGVDLSMILAVNKDITNPDVIIVGQVIQIRAQNYKVTTEDYLDAIVKTYSVSLSALKELNGQIQNPDLIFPAVQPRESLSLIADKWGVILSSIEALNPEIEDKKLISRNQVVKIPMYMLVQGNLTATSSCPTCEADKKTNTLTGAKFARAVKLPKFIATRIEAGPTATLIVANAPACAWLQGFCGQQLVGWKRCETVEVSCKNRDIYHLPIWESQSHTRRHIVSPDYLRR